MRRNAWMFCILAACASLAPARLAAQTRDSLVQMLKSPDWGVRADAVVRLADLPAGQIPPDGVTRLIALLETEAGDHTPRSEAEGESYGEYLGNLVDLVIRFRDPRSLRGMALLGIQYSKEPALFVASAGAEAIPLLDTAWALGSTSRESAVMTLAYMVARYRSQLTDDDAGKAMAIILRGWEQGDPRQAAWAALLGPLPALTPIVQAAAVANPTDVFYQRANAQLGPVRDGVPVVALARQLDDVQRSLCLSPSGARLGACESLENMLADARKQLEAGRTGPAREIFEAFAHRVAQAQAQGAFTDSEQQLLAGNATYLATRIT